MPKTYVCPYFGVGAQVVDGQVTMRDARGVVKTFPCVRWREQECDKCRSEREPDGGPRELHERK